MPVMAPEVWSALIGGVAGLSSGTVAALGAPWAKWSIEKRRLKREHQYRLLESWRAGIAAIPNDAPQTDGISTDWYETLRPYLSADERSQLERPRTVFVPGDRGVRNFFTGAVDRIEREWGLCP